MTHRTKALIGSMSRRVKIAHLLIAKVKKRIWPIKRPLAGAVKGENLQNEMLPRLRRTHSLERKAKLAVFFTVRGLLKTNMILFAGRRRSKNRSTRESVDSRN